VSLFVAIRPSLEVVEHLGEWIQRLQRLPQARELRWQSAALWHVTLVFLGDPPPAVETDAVEALDEALSSVTPIAGLRLDGCGAFNRQVLWMGLEDGAPLEQLRAVVGTVSRSMREAGLRPDQRAWRPHLTVARSRSRQANVILQALAGFRSPAWSVDEVLLIRSSGGATPAHQVRSRSPLSRVPIADVSGDSSHGGAGASILAREDATSPKRSAPPVH
jgi:2'-5' RNA ligase